MFANSIKMLGYFRSHNGESKHYYLFIQIYLIGHVMSSPNTPSHEATSGFYTLTFYLHNADGKSYATSYDRALRKCNEKQSKLVVLNDSTKKMIDSYVSSSEYYWVHGKGSTTCTAYHGSQAVNRYCNDMYFYIGEQTQVNSIKLTNYDVTITDNTAISCTASGIPIPSMTWKRNNMEVPVYEDKISIYQNISSSKSVLHTNDATIRDEGEYTCHATNSFGSKAYRKSESTNVKVPSVPIIKSVTSNSCNSNLIIKWKPHSRAIGVKHKLVIRESISDEYSGTYYSTPMNNSLQILIARYLSPRSQYSIAIQPCSAVEKCYAYIASRMAITEGITSGIKNATIAKASKVCLIAWRPPKHVSLDDITRFQLMIKSSLKIVPDGVSAEQKNIRVFVNASKLTYNISSLPNRNYTVYIQAETCAGVGDVGITSGDCVTDVAAPAFIERPKVEIPISNNGILQIVLQTPDESNGPIRWIFIVVQVFDTNEDTDNADLNFEKEHLRQMNALISEKEYIAITTDIGSIKEKGERNFLGDKSLSYCKLKNNENRRKKRESFPADTYVGRNKQLSKDLSYKIFMVTATLSKTGVFFKTSSALIVTGKTDKSQELCTIAFPIAGVLLVILSIVIIVLMKRISKIKSVKHCTVPGNKNRKTAEENNLPPVYEYPTINIGANTSYYKNTDCGLRKSEHENCDRTTISTSQVPSESHYETPQNAYELISK